MSHLGKLERTEERAYATYRAAAADVIVYQAELSATVRDLSDAQNAELGRLRRRAGAYRAQWAAAQRATEDAVIRERGGSTRVDRQSHGKRGRC